MSRISGRAWPLALLAAALAAPAGAQTVAATEGLGLSVAQAGAALPLQQDVDPDGGAFYAVALAPAPFELRLPPDPCPPDRAGTAIRALAGNAGPDLRAALAASGLGGRALADLAFPPGSGMAADPGPLTALMTADQALPPFEQPFNYVAGDRYAAQGAAGDVVAIDAVALADGDPLAAGGAFTLMVGRDACGGGPGAVPVEILVVRVKP